MYIDPCKTQNRSQGLKKPPIPFSLYTFHVPFHFFFTLLLSFIPISFFLHFFTKPLHLINILALTDKKKWFFYPNYYSYVFKILCFNYLQIFLKKIIFFVADTRKGRTFAARKRGKRGERSWDVCDGSLIV